MSDIDFQNGFACGMATKGLVRSGELYKPICWNDPGIYSYFYMSFKRALSPFSPGMFSESILLYDSGQLTINKIEFVSTGVYKVYCDISNCVLGVNIINKKSTLLSFTSGEALPVFSLTFFVDGLPVYLRVKYAYDAVDFDYGMDLVITQDVDASFGSFDVDPVYESTDYNNPMQHMTISELNISVVLV